jgi:hypothetical protein
MAKFTRKIRVVSTSENFENCLNVIEYFKVIDKMTPENKNKKLFHLLNESDKLYMALDIFSLQ